MWEILGRRGFFAPHPHPLAALKTPILNRVNTFNSLPNSGELIVYIFSNVKKAERGKAMSLQKRNLWYK